MDGRVGYAGQSRSQQGEYGKRQTCQDREPAPVEAGHIGVLAVERRQTNTLDVLGLVVDLSRSVLDIEAEGERSMKVMIDL